MIKNMSIKDYNLIALFAGLTAIGAWIKIPIPYVPFTLQFAFTALAGVLLGAKRAMLSQIVYVMIGLMGVPIFAYGGGLQYVLQPTFGYLIGFILASWWIGKSLEGKTKTPIRLFLSIISGLMIVYIAGMIYLYAAMIIFVGTPKSWIWVIQIGFLSSIAGDIILSVLLVMISGVLERRLKLARVI